MASAPDPRPDVLEFLASVQPGPLAIREILPDGVSIRDTIELLTRTELMPGYDGVNYPDRVVWNGVTYEVFNSLRLPAFLTETPHWETIAIRVQAQVLEAEV